MYQPAGWRKQLVGRQHAGNLRTQSDQQQTNNQPDLIVIRSLRKKITPEAQREEAQDQQLVTTIINRSLAQEGEMVANNEVAVKNP